MCNMATSTVMVGSMGVPAIAPRPGTVMVSIAIIEAGIARMGHAMDMAIVN